MPLTGSGGALGVAINLSGGITDPTGITKCSSLGGAICTWLVSNTIVSNIPPNGTMTAAGTAVTGAGRFDFAEDGDKLGEAMAGAIPATDPAGIAKWKKLGNAIYKHIKNNGRVDPATYVASPSGGAVTGTAKLTFTSAFSPTLASELDLADAANQAVWLAIGTAIQNFLASFTQVQSTGFSSPPGGGLLTGVSLIS